MRRYLFYLSGSAKLTSCLWLLRRFAPTGNEWTPFTWARAALSCNMRRKGFKVRGRYSSGLTAPRHRLLRETAIRKPVFSLFGAALNHDSTGRRAFLGARRPGQRHCRKSCPPAQVWHPVLWAVAGGASRRLNETAMDRADRGGPSCNRRDAQEA